MNKRSWVYRAFNCGVLGPLVLSLAVILAFGGTMAILPQSVSAVVSSLTLTAPVGGESWSGSQDITWTSDGDGISSDMVEISFTSDGSTFTPVGTIEDEGGGGTTFSVDTTGVPDGETYQVKITSNTAEDISAQFTVDNTEPTITLTGEATVNLTVGDTYNEEGATASDNIDGDISADIVVGGDTVDADTEGSYVVTYNVSDESGNTAVEVTRTVNVTAADGEDITLSLFINDSSSHATISADETFTFSWTSTNATSCTGTANGESQGDIGTSGSLGPIGSGDEFFPTAETETTFEVTCNDGAGGEAASLITVSLAADDGGGNTSPTVSLTVNGESGDLTIPAGVELTLSWNSENATSCSADANGSSMGSISLDGTFGPFGSESSFYPTAENETMFTIVCSDGSTQVSDSLTVFLSNDGGGGGDDEEDRPVLTVSANSQIMVEGDNDPTFTFTFSGFIDGDDKNDIDTAPTCTVSGAHSDVGTYTINCSGGVDDKYDFSYETGTLTITSGNSITLQTTADGDNMTATISVNTEMTETVGDIDVVVSIDAGTVITGPDDWDGTFNLPTVVATTVDPVADPNTTASTIFSIEIGLADTHLTFDKAIKITFAGHAGKLVGWSQGGVFHTITNICDNAENPTVGDDQECKIDVGADLVVWTRHFSTFTVYTQTPISSSGGGGGNISGSRRSGQVLGASIGPIPGCDVRTTGFSTVSGQPCTNNVPHSGQIPGCDVRTTGFSNVTGHSCVNNIPHSGQIPGCDVRTTGFSNVTGQSCVNNVPHGGSGQIPGCDIRTTGFSAVSGVSCANNVPHGQIQVLGAHTTPFFPNTGLPPQGQNVPWNMIWNVVVPAGVLAMISLFWITRGKWTA